MVAEILARAATRRARFAQTAGSGDAPISGACSNFSIADSALLLRQDRDFHHCIPEPDAVCLRGAKGTVRHHVAGHRMHCTCHWPELDVHDVGLDEMGGAPRLLEPDRILTSEPGIYVAVDPGSAPAACHGTGARIDNDVLVSPTGAEAPSAAAISKEKHEIETQRTITAAAS